MPVTYQTLIARQRYHCHAKNSNANSQAQPNNTMAHFRIAVQPPSEIQVGQILYPPIIAKMSARRAHHGVYFFAMAVLLGDDGAVLEGGLYGSTVSTGVLLNENGSSSRASIVFVFPDLFISYEGVFSVRLDLYKVQYETSEGATFEDQIETSQILVVDRRVPRGRPSKPPGDKT